MPFFDNFNRRHAAANSVPHDSLSQVPARLRHTCLKNSQLILPHNTPTDERVNNRFAAIIPWNWALITEFQSADSLRMCLWLMFDDCGWLTLEFARRGKSDDEVSLI